MPSHLDLGSGISLVELNVVLFIVGVMCLLGSKQPLTSCELMSVKAEFNAALFHAKQLARGSGKNVSLALGASASRSDILPLHLPKKVKWGKMQHVPNPPGMAETVVAGASGEAHPVVTLTPRNTATASVWFLNDGKDVLCIKISNNAHYQIFRWQAAKKLWKKEH